MTATTSCTDTIAPGDSAYDNSHAAEDIERLRSTWDVPALALLGIGNGAQVALAYAGSHPNKVARLVLDSPLPLGIAAEAAAEQRVKGEQAALDALAAQCAATNCPLGADPKGAVDSLLAAARGRQRARRRVGGRRRRRHLHRAGLPAGRPRRTPPTSWPSRSPTARSGDTNQLNNLINQAETLRADRRPVRQLLQRRAEPAHPRPGPRTRRGVGQALPAVRHASARSTWSNA